MGNKGTLSSLVCVGILCWAGSSAFAAAPANDNFASAIPLTGASFSTTGTNVEATKETGEPNHAGVTGGRSVWWTWTAPATPPPSVMITTFGSDFDTVLHVYTGTSVSTLFSVTSGNDGISPITTSRVTFSPIANTVYYIAVDGNNGFTGSIKLALPATPPPNDNFASATPLSGTLVTTTGYNFGGTRETGEPTNPINSGGPSVWYTWTAPSSGKFKISTYGCDYDSLSSIYTGSSISALTLLGADDDADIGLADKIVIDAVAGTAYYIRIEGFSGSTGSLVLNIGPGEGGPNVASSITVTNPLTGVGIAVTGSEGGLIQFSVSVSPGSREVFDINTDFDGIAGRVGSMRGPQPFQRFPQKGVFVATSTASAVSTGASAGKGRRTVAISAAEVGQGSPSVVDTRASKAIKLNKIAGKFNFVKATADQVSLSGEIELPSGLDLSQDQELSIGIGNVIETITVTPKGAAKDRSKGSLGRISKLKIKYPKLAKGTTVTGASQVAKIDVALKVPDLDVLGFDTEGITATLRPDEPTDEKFVQRSIQTALVLAGISYESQLPVQYALSKKADTGQIAGRASKNDLP